ncbi:copper amine oxidase [Cercophora scortea]|uniref:Amine oxidase n=1 Tax=Cercophora scortea TaxID=314031 RepID=A0AAE0J764_9PEZI|nr:copper amine oxidase [Cercophora scortea]
MVAYLDSEHGIDHRSSTTLRRISKVQAYVDKVLHEFSIDLDHQTVLSDEIHRGRHSHIDPDFMRRVELACMAHPCVRHEIELLRLPQGATVVVEPWTYGTDGMNEMSRLVTMCWFYMRLSSDADANYYAYPLQLAVEMSSEMEVTNVFHLSSRDEDADCPGAEPREFDHHKIHNSSEYHPALAHQRRTTLKPYQVVQPEGPSFSVDGNHVSWEKWTLRVGFNYREGMTLHDIRYDNRSLFYRLSLSEMFVPYGDPRAPYPRKAAFDLGNDGAGICANNLKLGCDCLGHIKYFDGWLTSQSGTPLKMPNVICLHEVDDGILWKHTNPRTGNAAVTRSRLLVLQTIITVSNYEYIFLFYFGQDASIHYEIRATGILSTAPINIGDSVPNGTVVAPGVLAPYHQHLFCLRIDPAIDGRNNSLMVEESHPMPLDDDNPFGVGYTVKTRIVPSETGLDLSHATNRTFKIINETKTNSTTGTPVGFKLVPHYSQMLLAHPTSFHAKRSEFAAHAVWVTRHSDDELFPSGKFTMQSLGGDGIASWISQRRQIDSDAAAERRSVRDKDLVVWHTFGSTHNPRAEDWPVMPCEKMVVGLKPVNFFERNPALDVAISTQEKNLSVLVEGVAGNVQRSGGEQGCCTSIS